MSDNHTAPATSALLSYTASNVRSYRDEVHFSMLATRLARENVRRDLWTRSSKTAIEVLPAAGIFGANASGKSTILLAMADMRAMVINSFRTGTPVSGVLRLPFALDDACRTKPSRHEIDLIVHGVRWQYGLEVDGERVIGEYAYYYPKGRQALVYNRTEDDFSFGQSFRPAGGALRRLLRENALLLSVAGAAGDDLLSPLFEWFLDNLGLATAASRDARVARTAALVDEPATKQRLMALLSAADLGIRDVERVPVDPEVATRLRQAIRVFQGEEGEPTTSDEYLGLLFGDTVRLKHRGASGDMVLEPEFESQGTMVWVSLIGPMLDALDNGHVLLVDELDASLHPHLVASIVEMFQNPDENPRCAQLIFNAHDVGVMGDAEQRALGRDQIWFTEKQFDGATTLYSLADFGPRRDEALGRRYLQGRFGAIPVIDQGEIRAGLELVNG